MNVNQEILRPLVAAWGGKIQEATKHKQRFNDTADQCMAFFNGSAGFMWEPAFLNRYIGGGLAPRFKITIAKAFELVALFGPTLYWRNPTRLVKPRNQISLRPELFMGLDPTGQLFEMSQMQNVQQHAIDDAVSQMLELYLNYTPTEQPGGGLANHASQGITEALVKGRGCLWPRPYSMPSSNRVLTGCFYDSVDNLLIDPDATNLQEAKWIAQRCVQPTWEVERQFGLPPGTLAGRGTMESGNEQGRSQADPWAGTERRIGKTFDLLTYYKIYSKGGVGGRLGGGVRVSNELAQAFDQVVGDYAYVVVAPHIPFPLNAPTEVIRNGTDSEIEKRFRWPVPYWLDDRWPVSVVDFYKAPNSPWPIAPMAPGLGELAYLNILLSQIANHIWMSSRTFFAMDQSLPQDIQQSIESGKDLSVLKAKLGGGNKIKDLLDFIQAPAINPDVWRIIDQVSAMFDKRVGLSELLYGANPGGVASRSAEDIKTKTEMVSIRPDYMAGKVEDWMTEAADMEKLCARWFVEKDDLQGFFGPVEQMIWNQYVVNEDPEYIVREMRATVAANSTRKPDKARDTQNMQQVLPALLPVFQQHMEATGDPSSFNAMLKQWGKTIDQDMSDLFIQPPPGPSGNPEAEAAAQAQQQQLQQAAEQHQQRLQQTHEQHQHRLSIDENKALHQMRLKAATTHHQNQLAKQKAAARPKPKSRSAA